MRSRRSHNVSKRLHVSCLAMRETMEYCSKLRNENESYDSVMIKSWNFKFKMVHICNTKWYIIHSYVENYHYSSFPKSTLPLINFNPAILHRLSACGVKKNCLSSAFPKLERVVKSTRLKYAYIYLHTCTCHLYKIVDYFYFWYQMHFKIIIDQKSFTPTVVWTVFNEERLYSKTTLIS